MLVKWLILVYLAVICVLLSTGLSTGEVTFHGVVVWHDMW